MGDEKGNSADDEAGPEGIEVTANQPEEDDIEKVRTSIYQVFNEKLDNDEKRSVIHRLAITGNIQEGTKVEDALDFFSKVVKNSNPAGTQDDLTGLLLVYPDVYIAILESYQDVLENCIRKLYEMELSEKPMIKNSRILVFSVDVAQRMYFQWMTKVLDMQTVDIEGYETTDTMEKLVIDTVLQMNRLGHFIMKVPRIAIKQTLENLREKQVDNIPSQAVLNYLCEEENFLQTLNEYIDITDSPFHKVLQSDLVWPLGTRVFPIK